ncbi:S-adenosyl-L-methionine-dependent methyltransferases superfamily protein [Euphorbia peplus]|nr:S-adenosyl-L-methionine-dependent methyltransferases superfamily protein [Euphorbia peplus]
MASMVKEMTKNDVAERHKVIGGLGTNSYFNNSTYQKLAINVVKGTIDDEIMKKLDVESFVSLPNSNTIRVADLGCAVGPNTFNYMQDTINAIKHKYHTQCPNSNSMPEFQVLFNDQTSNDFNTLFAMLPPERDYFAAAVPGSFYDRLFPECSVHVAHCHYALYWLSEEPEELKDRSSPAWNRGRIHYTSAPEAVVKAYANQWAKGFNDFLNARAKEIMAGGMLIIIMPSIPDEMPHSEVSNGILFNFLAATLLDMAQEGMIKKEEVDAFNLPIYSAPPGEVGPLIEKNGYFNIESIGLTNPSPWLKDDVHVDLPLFLRHTRAAWDSMFFKHFSTEIVTEIFERLRLHLPEIIGPMENACRNIQFHCVLQRKF